MDQSSPSSRPRTTSRAFSHKSDHSRSSKHEVLADNPAEKQRRDSFWKGGSKANPNAAINEAQPGGVFFPLFFCNFPITVYTHYLPDYHIFAFPTWQTSLLAFP